MTKFWVCFKYEWFNKSFFQTLQFLGLLFISENLQCSHWKNVFQNFDISIEFVYIYDSIKFLEGTKYLDEVSSIGNMYFSFEK